VAYTFTSLLVHVIFSTKDRQPILAPELRTHMFPYMGGIIRELKGVALPSTASKTTSTP
jgi:hypothetical protein